MAKNFRKRRDGAWKKKAKKRASLLSSSGRESPHYSDRCSTRGAKIFEPVRRKAIERKIKNKTLITKKLTRGRVLVVNKASGEKRVLSKNLKAGITFMAKT